MQVSGSTDFYEIAGGAPLIVSNWSDVGGAQPYTVITQQQFDALNPVPTNGTLVETDTGAVYLIAGGAPMFVSNLTQFGSPQPLLVDQWDIDNVGNPLSHLNVVPSNGTFLTTTTGLNYRVAGGAPIGITTWSVFGGAQPAVTIDPWDVENIFNPAAHLRSDRRSGPWSRACRQSPYWEFGPKNRYLVAPSPAAVRVDDHGLRMYSAIPCRVPGLGHMTLAQVKTALMKADCRLGKVHDRPLTRRRHTLRVIKQSPEGAHEARGLLHGRGHAGLTAHTPAERPGRGAGDPGRRVALHCITVAPHVRPPPNAASSTRSSRLSRPSASATDSAIGSVAVEAFANRST